MGLLSIFDRFRSAQQHFSEADEQRIVEAIRAAEMRTSGEIRIYIEHRCRFVDPVDRAAELFFGLKMEQTQDRNGVLIYIARKDHQRAVFGDEGIHRIVGSAFWNGEVAKILAQPELKEKADASASVAASMSPADMASKLKRDTAAFKEIIEKAKITAD